MSKGEEVKDLIAEAGIRGFNDGIRIERRRVIELLARTICDDFRAENRCSHPTCLVLDFKLAEIKGAYGE